MLDKSMAVVGAVAGGARTVAEIMVSTGIPRPTAHRLVAAMEVHGILRRNPGGQLVLGLTLLTLGREAEATWPLIEVVRPVLVELRDITGESVQLFAREGDERVCIESLESPEELRTTVPLGARLPLDRGSAGRVLAAGDGGGGDQSPGWVESVEDRAPGVASVSARVQVDGTVVAVSVSGPVERTTRHPGLRYGAAVVDAARRIEAQRAASSGC